MKKIIEKDNLTACIAKNEDVEVEDDSAQSVFFGNAKAGDFSAQRVSEGNAKAGVFSSQFVSNGCAKAGFGSAQCVGGGNAEAGGFSAQRVREGNAEAGNGSVQHVLAGNAEAGDGSVQIVLQGTGTVGENSITMAPKFKLGKNSVGVVLDEDHGIKTIVINAPKNQIKIIWDCDSYGLKKASCRCTYENCNYCPDCGKKINK